MEKSCKQFAPNGSPGPLFNKTVIAFKKFF